MKNEEAIETLLEFCKVNTKETLNLAQKAAYEAEQGYYN